MNEREWILKAEEIAMKELMEKHKRLLKAGGDHCKPVHVKEQAAEMAQSWTQSPKKQLELYEFHGLPMLVEPEPIF